MFDKHNSNDVPGFERVTFTSQGSVSTVEASAHVFIVNEPFDEEFVAEVKAALRKLGERLKISGS
jgi:hypothetical protein